MLYRGQTARHCVTTIIFLTFQVPKVTNINFSPNNINTWTREKVMRIDFLTTRGKELYPASRGFSCVAFSIYEVVFAWLVCHIVGIKKSNYATDKAFESPAKRNLCSQGKELWSVNKFSQLILKGKVWQTVWRICIWTLVLKGLIITNIQATLWWSSFHLTFS